MWKVSKSFEQKRLTSEKSSVSPSSTSWSSVSTRIMLGRMFFRSCCIRPLNLWDLTVEQRLPSSSVPRTAKTSAQQENCIVFGPMLRNRQNVSASWVLQVWAVREKGRGGDENEIQTPNTVAEKGLQQSESWHVNCEREGCTWVRSGKLSQELGGGGTVKHLIILQIHFCLLFSFQLFLFQNSLPK